MDPKAGRFVSVEDGRVLGAHGNAMFLTVGQGAKVRQAREGWTTDVCVAHPGTDGWGGVIMGGRRTGHAIILLLLRTDTHTHIPAQPHLPPPPQPNTQPQIGGVPERWFVCGKDTGQGLVFVCPGTHHPALYTDALCVARGGFNWIGPTPPEVRSGA